MNYRARLLARALEDRCVPAIFTVTTTADSGPGSLRQAVLDSNAMPGLDTIMFNITGPGMINVTSGALVITDPLNIDGSNLFGRKITANNNNQIFVFSILGAGGESQFNDLYLTKGNGNGPYTRGGAIFLDNDALRLTRVTITNCTAGSGAGIGLNGGKLTVEDSVMSGNVNTYVYSYGGAIGTQFYNNVASPNQVIIRRSSFSNNKAWYGGAVYFSDTSAGASFLIEESTLYNNTANYDAGGGSLSAGAGGAISANGPTISVVQCTISGNTVLPIYPSYPSLYGGMIVIIALARPEGLVGVFTRRRPAKTAP